MSDWQVIILRPARHYLERLPHEERKRILDAFLELQKNPETAPIKPLRGKLEWRLRIGDIRALLMVNRKDKRIVVTRIGPRGDIYK